MPAGTTLRATATKAVASVADDAETVIATLAYGPTFPWMSLAIVRGLAAVAIDDATTAWALKIRKGGLTGTQVGATFTRTYVAAETMADDIMAIEVLDTAPGDGGGVYVLTTTQVAADTAQNVYNVALSASFAPSLGG